MYVYGSDSTCLVFLYLFFSGYGYHRHRHVLTHSVPTRRSSDLPHEMPRLRRIASMSARSSSIAGVRLPADGATDRFGFGAETGESAERSEEHTSELESLMRISYDVFCVKKKKLVIK